MWLRISALLMLAYPFLAPAFLWLHKPLYLVVLLTAILLFLVLDRIQGRDFASTTLILSGIAAITILVFLGYASLLVFIPPVLIPFGLFLLFQQSLGKQSTPLITRYAEIIEGNISQEKKQYTHKLTMMWRSVFLIISVESLLLAVIAPVEIWAWFTHVINYLFIALFFLLEYIYRLYRFGRPSMTFWSYLKKISNLRPKDVVVKK